jgi:hypothetical protein
MNRFLQNNLPVFMRKREIVTHFVSIDHSIKISKLDKNCKQLRFLLTCRRETNGLCDHQLSVYQQCLRQISACTICPVDRLPFFGDSEVSLMLKQPTYGMPNVRGVAICPLVPFNQSLIASACRLSHCFT